MYDIVFKNGLVVDGSGAPGQRADVAVRAGCIAAIGRVPQGAGKREYDIEGLVISPGFIDTHSHSDVMALAEPDLQPKLRQGITTELLGQDGIGPAPLPDSPEVIRAWKAYLAGLEGSPALEWDWRSLDEYAGRLEARPVGCNMAPLLPQGNVRMRAVGLEDRPATEAELRIMEAEVDAAMAAGAWGVSLGMVYMPCVFSSREEYIRVFRRTARHGGFLAVHMRNGSSLLLESLDELLEISNEAGIGLHVSHFKAAGRPNWHKMTAALQKMEAGFESGRDVSFDIYPYTAASTMFSILLPPWVLAGGMTETLGRLRNPETRNAVLKEWVDPTPPTMRTQAWDNPAYLNGWENVVVTSAASGNPAVVGRRMTEIAAGRGISPGETALELMLEERGEMSVIYFSMDEERVAEGIRHPLGMICTDGLLGGMPHPRVYGSFPRVLARYVRERGELTLEAAVHKMTGKPAARIGLRDRGLLRRGLAADVVVFSPDRIADVASYENPRQFPTGIEHVLVNGVQAVERGEFTGKLGGKVLRRPRHPGGFALKRDPVQR